MLGCIEEEKGFLCTEEKQSGIIPKRALQKKGLSQKNIDLLRSTNIRDSRIVNRSIVLSLIKDYFENCRAKDAENNVLKLIRKNCQQDVLYDILNIDYIRKTYSKYSQYDNFTIKTEHITNGVQHFRKQIELLAATEDGNVEKLKYILKSIGEEDEVAYPKELLYTYFKHYKDNPIYDHSLATILEELPNYILNEMLTYQENGETIIGLMIKHCSLENLKQICRKVHFPNLISFFDEDNLESLFDRFIMKNGNEAKFIIDYNLFKPKIFSQTYDQTGVIYAITQCHHLRILIKHPLVVSFLLLKWQKLKIIFWLNLILYIVHLVSFTLFLVSLKFFGNVVIEIVRIFLIFMNLLVCFREINQMYLFKWKYLLEIDNCVELLNLCLIFYHITLLQSVKDYAGITIFLFIVDLYLILGKHPDINIYVAMFRRVTLNFFKQIFIQLILLFAFGVGFHFTIFRRNNFLTSLSNTVIMFAGEYNTEKLKIGDLPVIHLIFVLLFLILIPVILQNFLIGLAVSDIQKIRNDSEILEIEERVKYIWYLDKIVFEIGEYFSKGIKEEENGGIIHKIHAWCYSHLIDYNKEISVTENALRYEEDYFNIRRSLWTEFENVYNRRNQKTYEIESSSVLFKNIDKELRKINRLLKKGLGKSITLSNYHHLYRRYHKRF